MRILFFTLFMTLFYCPVASAFTPVCQRQSFVVSQLEFITRLPCSKIDEIELSKIKAFYLRPRSPVKLLKSDLEGLTSLQYFSTEDYYSSRPVITEIETGAMDPFKHELLELGLCIVDISNLQMSDFYMRKLERLSLKTGKMNFQFIHFLYLTNLKSLELTQFSPAESTIEDYAFSQLSLLGSLTLNGNFRQPTSYTLYGLDQLKGLYIKNSKWTRIDSDWLDGLQNLIHLNIQNSRVREIDDMAFLNLKNLQRFTMNFTPINEIPKLKSQNLSLNTLDLQNNRLKELNDDAFLFAPNLSDLNISNNSIQKVHTRAFNKLPKLYKLNLAVNPIENLTSGTFSDNQNLNSIIVNDTNLSFLDVSEILSIKSLNLLNIANTDLPQATVDQLVLSLGNKVKVTK